jgi:hypothetical protein
MCQTHLNIVLTSQGVYAAAAQKCGRAIRVILDNSYRFWHIFAPRWLVPFNQKFKLDTFSSMYKLELTAEMINTCNRAFSSAPYGFEYDRWHFPKEYLDRRSHIL